MESPSPRSGRPPFVFAFLIAVLSLGAIWFSAAFILPKTQDFLITWPPYEPVPAGGQIVLSSYHHISTAVWVAAGFVLLLSVGALLRGVPTRLRRLSAWVLHSVAVLLFAGVLYVGFVAVLGMIWANNSAYGKFMIYQQEIETFALTTLAERREDRVKELLNSSVGRHSRTVASEDEMKPIDRRRRLAAMAEVLQKSQDPRAKRSILATLPLFQKYLQLNHGHDETFLRHARELSGQDFPDMKALLGWLPTAPREDGWEPVPLQIIE